MSLHRPNDKAATYEFVGPEEPEVCEEVGHEWAPAGGGLLICMRCETEQWEDEA